jgi:hypothetical protein
MRSRLTTSGGSVFDSWMAMPTMSRSRITTSSEVRDEHSKCWPAEDPPHTPRGDAPGGFPS